MAVDVKSNVAGVAVASSDDVALAPFLLDNFDPAEHLNAVLPSLSVASTARDQSDRATLAELSTKTQQLLTQMNAQTSRLSNNLTQLTDEIIRSGSRLAYEVEILRGETSGLSEVLVAKLKDDIELFSTAPSTEATSKDDPTRSTPKGEPDYVAELRMLTNVRSRLDSVIKVFGDAMEWPAPPSETASTSIISVSAPDTGGAEGTQGLEEKARAVAQKLRDDITGLLSAETPEAGVAAANARIDQLRRLAGVWKGTAEEKYRARFVEGLVRLVDEEQRKVAARSGGRRVVALPGSSSSSSIGEKRASSGSRAVSDGSYGFMNSLRKIRGDT